MPFRTRLLTDPTSGPEPDVKIFFHGQLLLRSEDGMTCEVGVNPIATNHVLTVEARTKTPGKPDLINMRHVGPLHFRQPHGMTIKLTEDEKAPPPIAWKCITLDPIDYTTGDGPPKGPPDEDFRWILNLEGGLFHGRELNPAVFGTQHVIKLQGGQYFFQTARKSDGRLSYIRTGGGKPDMTFKKIGAIARASVFLLENQGVMLSWQDGSQEEDRVLTLTKSTQGSTYEIYIENTPLYEDLDPSSDLSKHDELIEYYKVIPEIPQSARFKFAPPPPHPRIVNGESAPDSDTVDSAGNEPPEAGSPSIPCQIMTLDGPA